MYRFIRKTHTPTRACSTHLCSVPLARSGLATDFPESPPEETGGESYKNRSTKNENGGGGGLARNRVSAPGKDWEEEEAAGEPSMFRVPEFLKGRGREEEGEGYKKMDRNE